MPLNLIFFFCFKATEKKKIVTKVVLPEISCGVQRKGYLKSREAPESHTLGLTLHSLRFSTLTFSESTTPKQSSWLPSDRKTQGFFE